MIDSSPPVQRLAVGEVLSPDELHQIPLFSTISKSLLQKNVGSVVRRRFKKGETVCVEGQEGSTAFFILEGKVDVFISSSISAVASGPEAPKSWFKRMTSKLVGSRQTRTAQAASRYIPIDASVDLSYGSPVAQMGAGDIFGEMTCLNLYPRSATVRAAEDCVLIEMLRNILQMLQKNKEFKAKMEDTYRKRTLNNHLRGVPIFRELPSDFVDTLCLGAEFVQFEPGHPICKQGDVADAFYLIRIGHVKVSQSYAGGEMVVGYLSRGHFFGEIGLLNSGVRTATCTALDHVEGVRILKDDFDLIIRRFPAIREQLAETAAQRLESDRHQSRAMSTVFLSDFLEQSLMDAQNLLILDLEKCTRCDDCVRACASAHDGITRLLREGIRFDKYLVATSCRQCRDPLCLVGCPVGSIRRQQSREILIEDWCIGCGLCAKQCPYDNINIHEFSTEQRDPETGEMKTVVTKKATVCDLCGQHDEPACVYACPHDAAHRVDPKKFFATHAD